MGKMTKGILVDHKDVNIFWIYFPLEKKIKQIRNITFVEKLEDDALPIAPIHSFLFKDGDDLIIPNKSILSTMSANSTNFNYHSSLFSRKPLYTISSTSSASLEPWNDIHLDKLNNHVKTNVKGKL